MAKRIKRGKKKKLSPVVLTIMVMTLGFGIAFFIGFHMLSLKFEEEKGRLETQILDNQRVVYVANVDIMAGTAITQDNVAEKTIYSSLDIGFYMTADDIGKIARVDISAGQPIFYNQVGDDSIEALRETEYASVTLAKNISAGDFVDVRIMYPNGENYIVLSKKCIQNINTETNDIYFWMDEEEIMLMSSGIVDCYLNEGAVLYTTKYLEDTQKNGEVDYVPSQQVMMAIKNDPNIVETAEKTLNAALRQSLENRLSQYRNGNYSVNLSGDLSSDHNTSDEDDGDDNAYYNDGFEEDDDDNKIGIDTTSDDDYENDYSDINTDKQGD